jgi:hypothetical protein|tara:strand:- start:80 stop:310 length:231 start_codon:yes stop_codon:yes gene_type:complete
MPEIRQKTESTTVSTTEIVEEGGKMVKKTVNKTILVPKTVEVDLYDADGTNVIGKYNKPVMEQFGTADEPNEWVEI